MECEFLGQRLIAKYFTRALMGLIYQQPQRASHIEKAAPSSEGGGETIFALGARHQSVIWGKRMLRQPLPTAFDSLVLNQRHTTT
jgi:hypothetical protein